MVVDISQYIIIDFPVVFSKECFRDLQEPPANTLIAECVDSPCLAWILQTNHSIFFSWIHKRVSVPHAATSASRTPHPCAT